MRRALLDVNVLIAALDGGHAHHGRVRDWLSEEGARGWASCPITQNGCIRILSQPGYPSPLRPAEVIERLREATDHASHAFWADDVSLLDTRRVRADRVLGPRQVTDLYLLALAVKHGGRLVTLDGRIPLEGVAGAGDDHLVVL
ncbi:MAG: TA system VapC family ribonuclease toxin [Myxococcota bacterium]